MIPVGSRVKRKPGKERNVFVVIRIGIRGDS
jgi:hypothetical protein